MRRIALTILLAALPLAANAQSVSDVADLEVLPGWRQSDGTHVAGLRITLLPGWKTYWRAPGDAGIPPRFDWTGSENLAAAGVRFPVPDVFDINGLRVIGYSDSVVFPLLLRPQAPGQDIALQGTVELGVCETICLPFDARIRAQLPASAAPPDPAIGAALAAAPREGGGADCEVTPISDGLRLDADLQVPHLGAGEVAVVETSDPGIWVSEAEVLRAGDRLSVTADLVPPEGAPFALDRSGLRFTVLGGGDAVEITGC